MPKRLVTRRFWVRNRGVIGYLILLVGVIVALAVGRSNDDKIQAQARLGAQTHVAACQFRAVLRTGISQSRRLLAADTELTDIQRTALRVSIHNQSRAIHALGVLTKC